MGGTTGPMRVSRWAGLDTAARERLVRPASRRMFDADLRRDVRAIIEDVRAHGDEAVSRALERFDGCKVPPDRLRVTKDEIEAARAKIPAELALAIRRSIDGVRRFNERLMERRDWRVEVAPGLEVGEKASPDRARSACSCRAGRAPFPRCWSRSARRPWSRASPGSSSWCRRCRARRARSTRPCWWRPTSSASTTWCAPTGRPASPPWRSARPRSPRS